MPVGELPVITTTHAPNQAARPAAPAAPAAPDPRNALMDAIRKGTQLKVSERAVNWFIMINTNFITKFLSTIMNRYFNRNFVKIFYGKK